MTDPYENVVAKTYWVWTPLSERLHPERIAGAPIWEWLRKVAPKSWFEHGYIEEASYEQLELNLEDGESE